MSSNGAFAETDAGPAETLAAMRAHAEVLTVGAILADPAAGIRAAAGIGLAAADFDQPDLRLIFCAAEVAADFGRMNVLWLARRGLRAGGFWDETQIAGNWGASMLWSDASLAWLAESYYRPNEYMVRVRGGRLLWIIRAQRLAEKLMNRAEMVLRMAISPITERRPA